ncbi:MAG: DNA-binding protein [Candidatus Helarchaeota archaeon]
MSDDELEALRKKRREKFLNRIEYAKKLAELKKEQEEALKKQQSELEEKKEIIMEKLMFPDAYQYFLSIKSRSPAISKMIEDTLIYLVSQNQLRNKLQKVDLQIIERKIIGKEPTIKIKRHEDEEAVELSAKLREDKE